MIDLGGLSRDEARRVIEAHMNAASVRAQEEIEKARVEVQEALDALDEDGSQRRLSNGGAA